MTYRRILKADIDPRSLQSSLKDITQRMGIAEPDTIAVLFGRWTELVGEAMAEHVVPLQIRAKTLYVEVPDPSWAMQFRYLESQVLKKIAADLGSEKVERITVRVKSHRLE